MKTIKERVQAEKTELDVRRDKLNNFILRDARFNELSDSAKQLLTRQSSIMNDYSGILHDRLALLETESPNV